MSGYLYIIYNESMRKVVIAVVIAGLLFVATDGRQLFAYTITPADTTVSAIVNPLPTLIPVTPTATPSATPTATPSATPSVSPTPSVSVTPTPTMPYGERFSLFGYTSPGAIVSVSNPGMYRDTTADRTGYFTFVDFFIQTYVEDICLMAQDQAGRVTMPVCIPPTPDEVNHSIGPVIMPPTLSLNNDTFYSGDAVILSGQTAPHSDIQLSLFTDESKSGLGALQDRSLPLTGKILALGRFFGSKLALVPPSYAATKPKQSIKVDDKGNFTMALKSSDPEYFRTFAQTLFRSDYSMKSVTLNFNIFPGWFAFIKWAIGLFNSLKGRIPELIILSQIVLVVYLFLRHYLQPHRIANMRALALIEHPLPVLTEHELVLREHELNLEELIAEKEALNRILKQR